MDLGKVDIFDIIGRILYPVVSFVDKKKPTMLTAVVDLGTSPIETFNLDHFSLLDFGVCGDYGSRVSSEHHKLMEH